MVASHDGKVRLTCIECNTIVECGMYEGRGGEERIEEERGGDLRKQNKKKFTFLIIIN
jgi:hypothetical protein